MEIEAHIAAIRQETPLVKSFVLELEGQEMPFLPGQYVDLVVDTDYDSLVGGFSIASSPLRKDRIQLAVKYRPDRSITTYLHQGAKVGDTALVLGPSGEFFYRPGEGSSLVLIAGGIGITPLMSMIRFVDEARLDTEVTLLYSAKTTAEFIFFEELQAIASRSPRIRCLFTVTRPAGAPWNGRTGRIDGHLLAAHSGDRTALFYICGPLGMADDVAAILQSQGVAPSRIRRERW